MPTKLTRSTLTEKHFRALQGRSHGLTFGEIAKAERVSESTIQQRFKAIRPFLHPLTLARLQRPDHTQRVVDLRLSGKTLRQIESETGIDYETVRRLLKRTAAGMDNKNAEKLAVGGTRSSPSRVTRIASRQRAIAAFFGEMDRFANPYGAMKRAARQSGLKKYGNLVYYLERAGINWQTEVRRRRLALALKTADTMHLTREKASERTGIPLATLVTYRAKIRRMQLPVGTAADVPEEKALGAFFEKLKRGEIKLPMRTKQFSAEHLRALEQTQRLDARPGAERVQTHVPEMEVAIEVIRAFRNQFSKLPPVQQVLAAQRFGITMPHPRQALIETAILSTEEKSRELEAAYATLEQHPLVKKLI